MLHGAAGAGRARCPPEYSREGATGGQSDSCNLMASVNRMKSGVISAGKEIGTFGLRAEHNSTIIGPDRLNTPVAEEAPFLTCGCLRALLPPLKKALPSGRVWGSSAWSSATQCLAKAVEVTSRPSEEWKPVFAWMTTLIAQNPYRETSYRALEIANRFTLQPPSGEGFFSQHELSRRHGQYASLLNIITFQDYEHSASTNH